MPFVDPMVFRAAFSLSGREKVSGTTGKVALKQAAEAWLPKEIIHRPKASFSAPLRAWVTRDLHELIDDSLLDGDLVTSGFLNGRQSSRLSKTNARAARTDRNKSGNY